MKWSVHARAVFAALANVIALGVFAPGCGGDHGSAASNGAGSTSAAGDAGEASAQTGDYSSSSAGTGSDYARVAGGASGVDLGTAGDGEAGDGEAGHGGAGVGGKGAPGGDPIVYDFEDGLDGWSSTDAGVQVNVSTEKFLTGSQSLHVAMPPLTAGKVRNLSVFNAPFWPGTKLSMSIWVPAGSDGLSVNGFSSSNNDQSWDVAGNSAISLTRGGWTTWRYTVPETFPGGLQTLGVQVGVKAGGKAFGGGDLYVDSIRASGGTRDCTGMPSGSFDFEGTGPTAWTVEEDAMASAPDDTSTARMAVDADHHGMGTQALEISFTNLPPPEPGGQTRRLLVLHNPDARCGQEVTFNVWAPTGSDLMLIQTFAKYDNGDMDIETVETLTRNGWSQFGYTLPDIGPGGLQSIGLQFVYVGAEPYTGKLYVDNIGW